MLTDANITPYTVTLTVTLDLFPAVTNTQDFDVTIGECEITSVLIDTPILPTSKTITDTFATAVLIDAPTNFVQTPDCKYDAVLTYESIAPDTTITAGMDATVLTYSNSTGKFSV